LSRTSETFGLQLDRIPILNLRLEFNDYQWLVATPEFAKRVEAPSEPIHTPLFLWNTMPEGLLTLILQRAILGLEAYLPGTVYVQLGGKPGYEEHVMRYVANPARLCRSIADAYFNRLPTLINPAHALRAANPELWLRTKRLYDEVRNPLFHGWQLAKTDVEGLRAVMAHIQQLYDWVDGWHDPEIWMPGAGRLVRRVAGEDRAS